MTQSTALDVTCADPTASRLARSTSGHRRERWRTWLCLALVPLLATAGALSYRARHARVDLLSTTVGVRADGQRVLVQSDDGDTPLYPATRVLRADADSPAGMAAVVTQRRWLTAGEVPAETSRFRDMATDALLDINTLTPTGASAAVAGWSPAWRYVWPRDAAFTAAALAQTGHMTDAVSTLRFLQRVQGSDGTFQARYLPDGSGVPDRRGIQLDGTGWSLWGAYWAIRRAPSARERAAVATQLKPLITRSTEAAMRLTASASRLPPVSADYWETTQHELTLGTAAAILCGLRSAAAISALLGDETGRRAITTRADDVAAAIHATFGPEGYPRTVGGKVDTAVAFLLPPFQPTADPAVVRAFRHAAAEMRRPAGGLAPGAGWKNDGISWTPETAIFALVASYTGDQSQAESRLDWLDRHRTPAGSIPEKVLWNGKPAAVAPLAWSAATVLLTLSSPHLRRMR